MTSQVRDMRFSANSPEPASFLIWSYRDVARPTRKFRSSNDAGLQSVIDKCLQPLIGLQYVTEYRVTSTDSEPRYLCYLCDCKADLRSIIPHLIGRTHRMKYIKEHHTNKYKEIEWDQRRSGWTQQFERLAYEIEQYEGRKQIKVNTDLNPFEGMSFGKETAASEYHMSNIDKEREDVLKTEDDSELRELGISGLMDKAFSGGRGRGYVPPGRGSRLGGYSDHHFDDHYRSHRQGWRGSDYMDPYHDPSRYNYRDHYSHWPSHRMGTVRDQYYEEGWQDRRNAPPSKPAERSPSLTDLLKKVAKKLDEEAITDESEARISLQVSNQLSAAIMKYRIRKMPMLASQLADEKVKFKSVSATQATTKTLISASAPVTVPTAAPSSPALHGLPSAAPTVTGAVQFTLAEAAPTPAPQLALHGLPSAAPTVTGAVQFTLAEAAPTPAPQLLISKVQGLAPVIQPAPPVQDQKTRLPAAQLPLAPQPVNLQAAVKTLQMPNIQEPLHSVSDTLYATSQPYETFPTVFMAKQTLPSAPLDLHSQDVRYSTNYPSSSTWTGQTCSSGQLSHQLSPPAHPSSTDQIPPWERSPEYAYLPTHGVDVEVDGCRDVSCDVASGYNSRVEASDGHSDMHGTSTKSATSSCGLPLETPAMLPATVLPTLNIDFDALKKIISTQQLSENTDTGMRTNLSGDFSGKTKLSRPEGERDPLTMEGCPGGIHFVSPIEQKGDIVNQVSAEQKVFYGQSRQTREETEPSMVATSTASGEQNVTRPLEAQQIENALKVKAGSSRASIVASVKETLNAQADLIAQLHQAKGSENTGSDRAGIVASVRETLTTQKALIEQLQQAALSRTLHPSSGPSSCNQ